MGFEAVLTQLNAGIQVIRGALHLSERFSRQRQVEAGGQGTYAWAFGSDPLPTELLPWRFEVDVLQQIPRVRMDVLVVNYSRKPLHVDSLDVSQLCVADVFLHDKIRFDAGLTIASCRSRIVSCDRQLSQAEVGLIRSAGLREYASGQAAVAMKGRVGRRGIERGPFSGCVVQGRMLQPSAAA